MSWLRPTMTAMAEKKVISGMMPAVTGPRSTEALSSLPAETRRLSAENPSSRPFWMTIDRPKVTSSGGRISLPSVRLSRKNCSPQPMANINGIAISAATNGLSPSAVTRTRIRKAASTIRSPWARLTSRMMPKTRLRPAANSA